MKNIDLSFEDAIKRLEEIVSTLEAGNTTLDESLKLFEEATKLCSYCNNRLDDAQKKIKSVSDILANSTVDIEEE